METKIMKETSIKLLVTFSFLGFGAQAGTTAPLSVVNAASKSAPRKKAAPTDQIVVKDQRIKVKDLNGVKVNKERPLVPMAGKKYENLKIETPQFDNLKNIAPVNPATWISLTKDTGRYIPSHYLNQPQVSAPLAPFQLTPSPELNPADYLAKEIDSITPSEFQLLEALVFLQLKENYELALALLSESMKNPRFSEIAKWNFTKAASQLGLRQEAIYHLSKLEKDPEWKNQSLKALFKLIKTTDLKLAQSLSNSVLASKIDQTEWEAFTIAWAKNLIEEKKLSEAQSILQNVKEDSPYKAESLYLDAIINYRSNNLELAEKTLLSLFARLEKEKLSWDLKSLTALTLARVYFQKEDYAKSFKFFLKIEKGNSIWVQSLVETAWAQILAKDYEGAAGNMFSLHTDYFKGAYQPESYIVRTVSYLNLCQYGDSLNVLRTFLHKYKLADSRMDKYLTTFKKENTYETVKKLLSGGGQIKEVDGLPKSLIIEMARDPKFLASQNQINAIEDEVSLHDKIHTELKEKEKKWLRDLEDFKIRLVKVNDTLKAKTDSNFSVQYQQEKIKLEKAIARTQLLGEVTTRAYQSLKELQQESYPRLADLKGDIKKQASLTLFAKLQSISKDLKHLIEQSQLLEYEIFSGAGEQLRYHMGENEGEQVPKQKRKLASENSMKWEFQGEIWEDEIGNFRSSLKNVCPENNTVSLNEK